jgi:hypothetical protein
MSSNYEMIIILLLGLIFIKLFFPQLISKYAPISINGTGVEPGAFFGLKESLQCAPGPSKDAAYYSRTDAAGGICGDQQFVNDSLRKYQIVDNM